MDEGTRAAVAAEMTRADKMLASLAGENVKTITVHSLKQSEAPLLGRIVSKLSPMIGNLLEARIIELLDENAAHGLRWLRQDPGFPDALLVQRDGMSTETGYEVKCWYALSTELTGRFRESTNLLAPRNIKVVIVAWMMSHVVYGSPLILDIAIVPGASIAEYRDRHYNKPPTYLTLEPQDTTLRTRNLLQTNVNGYRLQDINPAEAQALVSGHAGRSAAPHSAQAQALNQELMARFSYRLDTNFAKIDRIDHPDIEKLKARVLASQVRERSILDWVRLLNRLDGEPGSGARLAAEAVMKKIYEEL